jgi:hypothetical protein
LLGQKGRSILHIFYYRIFLSVIHIFLPNDLSYLFNISFKFNTQKQINTPTHTTAHYHFLVLLGDPVHFHRVAIHTYTPLHRSVGVLVEHVKYFGDRASRTINVRTQPKQKCSTCDVFKNVVAYKRDRWTFFLYQKNLKNANLNHPSTVKTTFFEKYTYASFRGEGFIFQLWNFVRIVRRVAETVITQEKNEIYEIFNFHYAWPRHLFVYCCFSPKELNIRIFNVEA